MCVVEINTKCVFYANIKAQIRNQILDFEKANSFRFKLMNFLRLSNGHGGPIFTGIYLRERNRETFVHFATEMLLQWRTYSKFFDLHSRRDLFLEVDLEDELTAQHIYRSCEFISQQLGKRWDQESLESRYIIDRKRWNDSSASLHEETLTAILKSLRPRFEKNLRHLVNLITKVEADFWLVNDLTLYEYCLNLDLSELNSR